MPSSAVKTRVVVVTGMAPIVKGDIAGARKASLDDAMKSALGLVVGIHLSQEACVSRVLLQDDTIITKTEGYIERYAILRESQENGFYKTSIKAEVRRDDLRAALNIPPSAGSLRNITLKINIDETVDGAPFSLSSAQNALKSTFARVGFTVTESGNADIVISGKAGANLVPGEENSEYVSYRAVLSLTAGRTGADETVAVVQETDGGTELTKEAAANAALVNVANRAARELAGSIGRIIKDHSVIHLTVNNVSSLRCLNKLLRGIRSLDEVKDCQVRTFAGASAEMDLEVKKGDAFEIARLIEKITSVRIMITRANPDGIQAICLFTDDF